MGSHGGTTPRQISKIRNNPWLLDYQSPSSEYLQPSQNAFHVLGVYGFSNLINVLLARDQDIDPDRQDDYGRTPLSYAAESGHTELVKALSSDGRVDLDRQDNEGRTALSYAAQNGHTEVVKALLSDCRVDPNRQDAFGRTPLSQAAEK